MLVYLAASRKIFLKDLEENELNAIMFAALASFFASALIIMIICFKNAYDVSKRTIPAFSLVSSPLNLALNDDYQGFHSSSVHFLLLFLLFLFSCYS
jgi:hypothetical protein